MENIQRRLDTVRADATHSYSIGDRATDPRERELFTQLPEPSPGRNMNHPARHPSRRVGGIVHNLPAFDQHSQQINDFAGPQLLQETLKNQTA